MGGNNLNVHQREQQRFVTAQSLLYAVQVYTEDHLRRLFADLSVLELVLVLAMKQLEDRNVIPYNFEMAYDQYHRFLSSSDGVLGVDRFTRPVAFKAFEHLLDMGICRFVGRQAGISSVNAFGSAVVLHGKQSQSAKAKSQSNSSAPQREYRHVRLLISFAQIIEILRSGRVKCPATLIQWAAKTVC